MGDDDDQHTVELPAYQISTYPVTNAQYWAFIEDDGYSEKWRGCWTEEGWKWKEARNWTEPEWWDDSRFNQVNQPVIGVSWYEAVAFCQWLTARL